LQFTRRDNRSLNDQKEFVLWVTVLRAPYLGWDALPSSPGEILWS